MNKAELIDAIAADTKLTKKDVDAVVKAFTENVAKSLEKVTAYSLSVLELSMLVKELQEKAAIQKQAKQLKLQLQNVQNSRQEKLLKTELTNKGVYCRLSY